MTDTPDDFPGETLPESKRDDDCPRCERQLTWAHSSRRTYLECPHCNWQEGETP